MNILPSLTRRGWSIHSSVLPLLAIASFWSCNSVFAINRQVFDCGEHFGDNSCYMDLFSPTLNYTFGRSEGQPPRGPSPVNMVFVNGRNVFGSTDVDEVYDILPHVHDYLLTKYGRNGPNGLGGTGDGVSVPTGTYRAFVHLEGTAFGASGGCNGPGNASAGTGNSVGFCLDSNQPGVVGHEMTHLVDRYESDLTYAGESGALDEGMADFFGESFERYVTGTNDWLATVGPADSVVRNMADPTALMTSHGQPYPDRYLSPYYYTGSLDSGGVHVNSSILNKASYLAVEGGTFNGYTITGIGIEKVEQIWYRALTEYFHSGETFNEAYFHLLQATDDLYGNFEYTQVRRALRAVEMHLSRNVPEPNSASLLFAAIAVATAVNRRHRVPLYAVNLLKK